MVGDDDDVGALPRESPPPGGRVLFQLDLFEEFHQNMQAAMKMLLRWFDDDNDDLLRFIARIKHTLLELFCSAIVTWKWERSGVLLSPWYLYD